MNKELQRLLRSGDLLLERNPRSQALLAWNSRTARWAMDEPRRHLYRYWGTSLSIVERSGQLYARIAWTRRQGKLKSRGTWVAESMRGKGIAEALWCYALEQEKPVTVEMTLLTDKGFTLASALRERFPNIKWVLHQGGQRSLRDLRKVA